MTKFSDSAQKNRLVKTPEGRLVAVQRRSLRGRKPTKPVAEAHPLRTIRLSRGLTLGELADTTGFSASYLSRLESGNRRLNIDTIVKLSKSLECSPNDLLSQNIDVPETTLTALRETESFEALVPKNYTLPVYRVCEEGSLDFSTTTDRVPCSKEWAEIPGAFAFEVKNDNMDPRYRSGDTLIVHPGRVLKTGITVFVLLNDYRFVIGEFIAPKRAEDEKETGFSFEIKPYAAGQSQDSMTISTKEIFSLSRVVGRLES